MLELIKKRKRNWLGHWLRRNCLLKDALEGMVNGKKVHGRRRFQMIDIISQYLNLSTKLTMYKTLLRSVLTYGSECSTHKKQ